MRGTRAAPREPAGPRGAPYAESGRRAPPPGKRRLTDLDDVAVGIADVAADLRLVLLRRRQELRAAGAPVGVDGLDVGDADVLEGADRVGVGGRREWDGRLVVVRPPPFVDDDPAVGERDVGDVV